MLRRPARWRPSPAAICCGALRPGAARGWCHLRWRPALWRLPPAAAPCALIAAGSWCHLLSNDPTEPATGPPVVLARTPIAICCGAMRPAGCRRLPSAAARCAWTAAGSWCYLRRCTAPSRLPPAASRKTALQVFRYNGRRARRASYRIGGHGAAPSGDLLRRPAPWRPLSAAILEAVTQPLYFCHDKNQNGVSVSAQNCN